MCYIGGHCCFRPVDGPVYCRHNSPSHSFQAILPIDLHPRESQDSRLTSRKSSIVISLPVSVEGGVPRLWKTRQIIKDVQKSSDPFVIYLASSALMSLVPSQYVRNVLTKATENTVRPSDSRCFFF